MYPNDIMLDNCDYFVNALLYYLQYYLSLHIIVQYTVFFMVE
jgi:hypothetical protein